MSTEKQYRIPATLTKALGTDPLTKGEIDKWLDVPEVADDPNFIKWYPRLFKKQKWEKFMKAEKIDESLGLVMGYGIVCKEKIEDGDYFDLQDDHIPQESMLEAAADFMKNSRQIDDMHDGETIGECVFAWPMTEEIAKAFDITIQKSGLLIAVKPSDEVLEKFKSGEYTGFSIGGEYVETEFIDG